MSELSREELIELASPPCQHGQCEQPITRVETRYQPGDEAGEWQLAAMIMVCAAGHRVEVEPFE